MMVTNEPMDGSEYIKYSYTKSIYYKPGFGVTFIPIYEDIDQTKLIQVEGFVCEIGPNFIEVIGDKPCVKTDAGFWVAVENFKELEDIDANDELDFRPRWFATYEEAYRYMRNALDMFHNPEQWKISMRWD